MANPKATPDPSTMVAPDPEPTKPTVTQPVPEVRQCQDQEDETNFGAVAVKSDMTIGNWFVGRPSGRSAGGHWADDNEVEDWKVLS